MGDASTADCKKFLESEAEAAGLPAKGAWKRFSKTKAEDGWRRVFLHESGVEAVVVEPFGAGAEGLRFESISAAPKLATPEELAELPADTRGAFLWTDAMRALGGKPPARTTGPGLPDTPTWMDFAKAAKDSSSWSSYEAAHEACDRWLEEAMSGPAGRAEAIARTSWCFSNDADYLQAEGYWNPGDGADVCSWATDAPNLEPGRFGHPLDHTDVTNQMEGVWNAGTDGATGAEAMAKAWDELVAAGFRFDNAAHKDFGRDCDYDEACPLERKCLRVIPALRAEAERKAIEKASAKASAAPKAKGI